MSYILVKKDCDDDTRHGRLIISIIILYVLPVTCASIPHYRILTGTGQFLIELYNDRTLYHNWITFRIAAFYDTNIVSRLLEAVDQRYSVKKVFLEISQNSRENTYAKVSFLIKLQVCDFIKKETLVQVFSCEFCEISKNTFS